MFQKPKPANKALALHLLKGKKAEDAALKHLTRRGYKLLDRNWRCKGGELDLVMLEGVVLVFVEVRLRSADTFGSALESITTAKQRRMVTAAQLWRIQHPPHQNRVCRIDVAEVSASNYETTVTANALSL